ncbi:unnamed protein product, partial [Rotaria magnacalcarata]
QQATTTSKSSSQASPSLNVPVNSLLSSPNNNLLTESTKNNNNTVKNYDQLPEYKLFSSNAPSIHNLLFGNNENCQQSQRP